MMLLIRKLSEPKFLLYLGVIYTLLITVAFLSPAANLSEIEIPYFDKTIHIILHSVLAFIWLMYFFMNDHGHISFGIHFVILLGCVIYGAVIETSQHWFIESRTFDLWDLIANGIGSLIGLVCFRIVGDPAITLAYRSKLAADGNQEKSEIRTK